VSIENLNNTNIGMLIAQLVHLCDELWRLFLEGWEQNILLMPMVIMKEEKIIQNVFTEEAFSVD
jgi:hypothetical protein